MPANIVKAIVVVGGLGLMTATVLVMSKVSKNKRNQKNN